MAESAKLIRQQLQQLRALHASGVLSDAQYAESRAPLERRLAGGGGPGPAAGSPQAVAPASAARPGLGLWALLAGVAIVVAGAGYFWTGAPERIGQAPAGFGAPAAQGEGTAGGAPHAVDSAEFAALIERLAARMKEQPDDADGWSMLGRSYMAMGRADEALPAFQRASKLMPNDAMRLADLADAVAVKNGRSLEGEPTRLIARALELDPDNLKALTLAGTAAFNKGDYAGAVRYWDRAVQVGPPDSSIVEQARSAAAEARERGKLPAAVVGAAPPAPAAVAKTPPAAAAGAVAGTVSLAPALQGKVAPDDTVFVFARPVEGSRVPIAIVRKQVRDLPYAFRLDDGLAMSPATLLSTAGRVVVGARVSKSGQATPQPGDLEGLTAATAVGSAGVAVVIASEVK
jgi:cytochrome c-type biogenesis protein CcmH